MRGQRGAKSHALGAHRLPVAVHVGGCPMGHGRARGITREGRSFPTAAFGLPDGKSMKPSAVSARQCVRADTC